MVNMDSIFFAGKSSRIVVICELSKILSLLYIINSIYVINISYITLCGMDSLKYNLKNFLLLKVLCVK